MLLWEECCEKCKKEGEKACSYPTFARGYKRYTVSRNYTSHVEHKTGVALEVDWSVPIPTYGLIKGSILSPVIIWTGMLM